jgi:hypothetical protein
MFDKMGTIVYTAQIREFPYRIATDDLTEGLYMVQIINGERSFSVQVIIAH